MKKTNHLTNSKHEIMLNYVFTYLILIGLILLSSRIIKTGLSFINQGQYLELMGIIGVFLFSFFLAYGGLVHLFARYGFLKRLLKHKHTSKKEVERFYLNHRAPSLIILLPSYKEEIPIIRQSLLSSALQNYPNRRVVLLIDNPPNCSKLQETRDLVVSLNNFLLIQHQKMKEFAKQFQERLSHKNLNLENEKKYLIQIYKEIVNWLDQQVLDYIRRDHTDDTFIELTFTNRISDLNKKIKNLNTDQLELENIKNEYKTLEKLFQVEISYFERKQYNNFSHASNKSMNLNSYIGALGKNYKETNLNGQKILEESSADTAEYKFTDADYISVLDADSVLTYDYASRLIYEMEQALFSNTAVIQTPYSAFPNAPGALEQMAGATTDIQYMIHQGFTYFKATFWVGANALIRKKALDDIVEHRMEKGYIISRYVQDRTVIEDTESSIDLASKGWQLYNFPERLSYSATPPDFGALVIQRKRWANGGLIIFPKALFYIIKGPFSYQKLKESFFRIHYLVSIPATFFSLALMQLSPLSLQNFPLEGSLITIPYLIIYSRDLNLFGYRYSDLFRIMSLNMILLPVNLAGVFQSLKQILFGKHTFFFRTPKITGLTPIPLIYTFSILCMLCLEVNATILNKSCGDGIMALLLGYGICTLLDLKTLLLGRFQKVFDLRSESYAQAKDSV
ncbi:MAG: glycosyltransferase family 2 protein [Parachlamydiaceae bacterium]|nr:glycosyltransferase family 2 protein [Parachlamydiaceae bacterium]